MADGRTFPKERNLGMGKKKMRLATYLIQQKLLTVEQAQEILSEQGQQGDRIHDRFGRLAMKKRFITEANLNKAILAKDRDEAGF
jgi:hypothetical protein